MAFKSIEEIKYETEANKEFNVTHFSIHPPSLFSSEMATYYTQYQTPQAYYTPVVVNEWSPLVNTQQVQNSYITPVPHMPVALAPPHVLTPICPYTVISESITNTVLDNHPDVYSNVTSDTYNNVIPDVYSNMTPDVYSNMTPDVYSNMTPDVYSNMTPDIYSNMTPDVYSNITPDVYSNITPYVYNNIIPNVYNNFPGVYCHVDPNAYSNVTSDLYANSTSDMYPEAYPYWYTTYEPASTQEEEIFTEDCKDEMALPEQIAEVAVDETERDPFDFFLTLPKELFPPARMLNIDPNAIIDEFCKLPSVNENVSWILDVEFGVPRVPVNRCIAVYNVKFNSIQCKHTPTAIHPEFEMCNSNFKKVIIFYYECVVSTWYRGYIKLNYDKSVEDFQPWLLIPMQIFGMCWP